MAKVVWHLGSGMVLREISSTRSVEKLNLVTIGDGFMRSESLATFKTKKQKMGLSYLPQQIPYNLIINTDWYSKFVHLSSLYFEIYHYLSPMLS